MSQQVFSLAALTVLELSPPEMIEVAAEAGYSHVGLRLIPATPEERHFPLLTDRGLQQQVGQRLQETGIRVLDIEILRLQPQTCPADFLPVLELGASWGATEVLVAGNDPDRQRLQDNFSALCELARPFGLHPHLEFMPWTDVPDLASARAVVEAVAQPNAGILVDAFHFNRSGSRLEHLSGIPSTQLRYMQLCDVAGPRPDSMEEILRQARQERRMPGEGDCDLRGLLQALPAGIPLSLEVPEQQLVARGVPALERARLALSRAREVLALR